MYMSHGETSQKRGKRFHEDGGEPERKRSEVRHLRGRNATAFTRRVRNNSRRVVINISGMYYETYAATLARFPDTLLGSKTMRQNYYNSVRDEYFFDRNRFVFDAVLFYYQSRGILACPEGVDDEIFLEELEFFQIKDTRLKKRGEDINHAIEFIKGSDIKNPEGRIKAIIWDLFYHPTSSLLASFIEMLSLVALLIVVGCSCAETVPSVYKQIQDENSRVSKFFAYSNTACHIWFIIEYLARFFSTSDKIKYVKSYDSVIDLCAIIPYFMQISVVTDANQLKSAILRFFFLRIIRVIRVLRVLKITRYFREMRAITYAIYASAMDLGNLILMSMMVLIFLSTIAYFIERNTPDTLIDSIPQGFWWALCTYTTVGLGDVYPHSYAGKVVGVLCMLSGMVCLGIPAYRLVDNFLIFWTATREMDPEDHVLGRMMSSIKGLSLVQGTLKK